MDTSYEWLLALEEEEELEDWYVCWSGWLRLQEYYERERE